MSDGIWKVEVLLAGSWRGATSVLLSNHNQRIVVDTGLPHEAHQLVKALEAKSLTPADITALVNTHFHVDHVLNNLLFPGVPIYASQQSYDWCRALYSDLSDQLNWDKLILKYYPETFDYAKACERIAGLRKFALRWWDRKRLGDASQFRWIEAQALPEGLQGVVTSGHVPGHLSLVMRTPQQSTVVAGDALLSRKHEEQVATMIPHDRAQFHLDRAGLLALGEHIVPGHDRGFSATSLLTSATPAAESKGGRSDQA
jgi:glyoxylase-like metal-dependent hydrolase (beta-lactamase superfamily II)